ncbi:MAG: CsgG/HfaB family protein [Treponema sp.]|nr:CsgG/HfaB family protein [Treponema sp.]
MKRTIILFCMTALSFVMLYAAPIGLERFTGTWVATVEYNSSFDTYMINFSTGNRCTVRVSNIFTDQEGAGTWSWDGAVFRLNALFRNAPISYQNNIQWTSVLTFVEGNDAFNILGRPAVNGPQMRFTFVKQDGFEQDAVAKSFDTISLNIPDRSRLAVVNVAASDPSEGAFYVDEITLRFVNARRYTVVDRRDIDVILAEQNFQISGYVDDNSAVSIGKFLGATVVITGNINGTGSRKRLVIKAIDVQTAEILAMSSVSL